MSAAEPPSATAEAPRITPWREGWLLDANAGLPRLDSKDLRLIGDATVGYNAGTLGLVGSGGVNVFSFVNERGTARTTFQRVEATAEGWWLGGQGGVGFELRPSLRFDEYTSSVSPLVLATSRPSDEASAMGRALALGGLRLEREALALGLWLGVGGQFEHYSRREVASIASGTRITNDVVTFTASARLRLQWALVLRVLTVRLRSDAIRFQITRDTEVTDLGASIANPNRSTSEHQTRAQIDAINRLFVDLEALAFAGFVPGVHGGLDVFARSSGEGSNTSVVPVAGAGIRRETF